MSASLFLFLDTDGKVKFDEAKIRNCLQNLQGVSHCRERSDTAQNDILVDCFYEFNQDSTTIFVPKDSSFVSIRGTGEASLQAALEVQKRYDAPIYVAVSESPANVVNLSTVSSQQELKDRLKR